MLTIKCQSEIEYVNFEKIRAICVQGNTNIHTFSVIGEYINGSAVTLGIYNEIQRAKCVLNEIINANNKLNCTMVSGVGYVQNGTYDMPEK